MKKKTKKRNTSSWWIRIKIIMVTNQWLLQFTLNNTTKKITMTAVRSIIFLFSLSFSPFFQENENDYFTISRPLTGNEEEDLKKNGNSISIGLA